jgi:hypothetical protein
MTNNPIHNLLLSRLSTFPTHRAYAKYLDCDEAELSRIVNGKQLISHRILVDLLTQLTTPFPNRTSEDILRIRQRVADGKLDLRDVGFLLDGKWDQDLTSRILDAALRSSSFT